LSSSNTKKRGPTPSDSPIAHLYHSAGGSRTASVEVRTPEMVEHGQVGVFSPLGSPGDDRNYVNDRLRAARAIYQSETLIMDRLTVEERFDSLPDIPRPRSGEENANPVFFNEGLSRKSAAEEEPLHSKIMPIADSPMSVNTEHMDNRVNIQKPLPLSDTTENKGVGGVDTLARIRSTEPSIVKPTAGGQKLRDSTPQRLRRLLTPEKRRAKTPDMRRSLSPERRLHNAENQRSRRISEPTKPKTPDTRLSRDAESTESESRQSTKKGFFSIFFRGKKKTRSTEDEVDGATVSSDGVHTTNSGSALKKATSSDSYGLGEGARTARVHGGKHRHNRNTSEISDRLDDDFFWGHDEVSTLTAPTVKSRSRRQDPADRAEPSSDPAGRYFDTIVFEAPDSFAASVDPFAAPFFEDLDNTTISSPSKSAILVNVDRTHDPIGESPLHGKSPMIPIMSRSVLMDPSPRRQEDSSLSPFDEYNFRDSFQKQFHDRSPRVQDPSPRGYVTPSMALNPVQDPFGESPLHKNERGPSAFRDGSLYAPDPPLHLDSLYDSEDSSQQDENAEEIKVTVIRKGPPTPSSHIALSPFSLSHQPPRPPAQVEKPSSEVTSSSSLNSTKETIVSAASAPGVPRHVGLTRLRSTRTRRSNRAPSSTQTGLENSFATSKGPEKASEPVDSDLILDQTSNQFSSGENRLPERDNEDELLKWDISENSLQRSRNSHLTMSSAARTNAKAVAYLHTLNGDPSPRRSWRKPEVSDDDSSPVKKGKALNRDPLDPFFSSLRTAPPIQSPGFEEREKEESEIMRIFSAYSNRFKGRKPTKVGSRSATTQHAPSYPTSVTELGASSIHVNIPTSAFKVGVGKLRQKRELDIQTGRSKRAVLPEHRMREFRNVNSYFRKEREPRDPIQRAGRRLLAKAAVPIQASIRRHLAQREAVNRLWALIEIQSYMRRWQAQVSLLAYRRSAKLIQGHFRGGRVRTALRKNHQAAVNIQRMARGYVSSARTFDTVYRIILLQAKARGNIERDRAKRDKEELRNQAASLCQAWWRCLWARTRYQFLIVDIIIAQNAFRRWRAQCESKSRLHSKRSNSARKIQAAWRGFQGYTDYLFSLVDIVVLQRTARQWIAKRRVGAICREIAATCIQAHFRRHKAQMFLLCEFVDIILVQVSVKRLLLLSFPLIKESFSHTRA
jgi:hypothetical protein